MARIDYMKVYAKGQLPFNRGVLANWEGFLRGWAKSPKYRDEDSQDDNEKAQRMSQQQGVLMSWTFNSLEERRTNICFNELYSCC